MKLIIEPDDVIVREYSDELFKWMKLNGMDPGDTLKLEILDEKRVVVHETKTDEDGLLVTDESHSRILEESRVVEVDGIPDFIRKAVEEG